MAGFRVPAGVIALLLVAGACSDDGPSASTDAFTTTTTTSTTASTTSTTGRTAASTNTNKSTTAASTTTSTTVPVRRHVATASSAPVVIVDAGAEPRRALRYGGADGAFAPVLRFDADGPSSLDPTGATAFEFEMGGGSADGGLVYTGTARMVAEDTSLVLGPATGLTQELRISRLGALELDSPISGAVNDIAVTTIITTLATAVPPLPEELVGVGARWTTRGPDSPTMGLLTTETTIELVEDRGDLIVLAVSSTGTGVEGFRGGFTNQMVETGIGLVTVELSTAIPVDGAIDYQSVVTPVNPPAVDEPPDPPWETRRRLTVRR